MDSKYVYPYSFSEAKHNGEIDLWRESHQQNVACRKAIEKTIKDSYDGYHLNQDTAKIVIGLFGYDRVNWILANTVQHKKDDGRFCDDNKKWAKEFYIPKGTNHSHDDTVEFIVETHPAVLDGFIMQARKEYQSLGLFDFSQCEDKSDVDLVGKLMVLNPTLLNDEYKSFKFQIIHAQHGFGCSPTASGRKVYGVFVFDGEDCQYNRSDFIGILKPEYLTDEMRIKLAKITPFHNDNSKKDEEQFDGYCYLGDGKYTPRVSLYGADEVKKYIESQMDYQHRLVICDKDDHCVFESVDSKIIFPTQENIENHQEMEMEL